MLLQKLTERASGVRTGFDALVTTWEPMLDRLPGWFWSTDENHRLTYVSDNVGRVTEATAQDLIGISILDPLYGDVKTEAGIQSYYDALLAHEPIDNLCYERNLKDGSRVVLMDSAVPYFDCDGVFKGYNGISIHVSHTTEKAGATSSLVYGLKSRADALEQELSRRNAELEAKNKLLTEVLEAMGEGLIVTSNADLFSEDTKIEIVNPAYRRLFGLDEQSVQVGMSIPALVQRQIINGDVPSDISALKGMVSDMVAGRPFVMDMPTQQKTTSVIGSKRKDGGLIIVHTDVTSLRVQNVELEKALASAEVATEAKSNFLATMSHEIRTPMNGIVGMSDLLAKSSLSKEQLSYVETIRSSALALTELISDILDFSKIEAGHLELDPAAYDLHALLNELCGLLRPLAHSNGLVLDLRIAHDIPKAVFGDAFRLRQILLNLLGNAVKFTRVGQVTLTVSCGVTPGELSFAVSDTGIGIPEDKLEHVFSPFEQVDAGLQRDFEGTGLGLSITRKIVDVMGGQLSVTSQLGKGSTFCITLPMEQTTIPLTAPANNDKKTRTDFAGLHVLVVEDNKTNQLVVKRMLEKSGVEITLTNNGAQACEAFRDHDFDLVLMDLSMPVMNGLEASTVIRRHEAKTGAQPCPIIALTGNAFEKDRDAATEAGMTDFLIKPVRLKDLLGCLEMHLAPKEDTTTDR